MSESTSLVTIRLSETQFQAIRDGLESVGYTPDQINSNGKAVKFWIIEILSLGNMVSPKKP